eukprot:1222636-Pyramimonas_sp.AAC.1
MGQLQSRDEGVHSTQWYVCTRTHPLAGGDGGLEEPAEVAAKAVSARPDLVHALHLAQDLALA